MKTKKQNKSQIIKPDDREVEVTPEVIPSTGRAEITLSPSPRSVECAEGMSKKEVAVAGARTSCVESPWFGMDEAVVGLAHRTQNVPCQDAAIAQSAQRSFIVLADGAGSAAVSDIGAQAVVTGIARLFNTLEGQWLHLLDDVEIEHSELNSKWPMLLVKHARGILEDTAKMHRRNVRELRCTLLGALVGRERVMWFKVGDGEIVVERTHLNDTHEVVRHRCVLGERGKGDFANQTTFIDIAQPQDVQWGFEPVHQLSGLLAMSDGAAERLVANDGASVASRVGKLLDELRGQRLKRQHLTRLFYSPEFCNRSSGDDRSVAMLAREVTIELKLPDMPLEIMESPLDEDCNAESAASNASSEPIQVTTGNSLQAKEVESSCKLALPGKTHVSVDDDGTNNQGGEHE